MKNEKFEFLIAPQPEEEPIDRDRVSLILSCIGDAIMELRKASGINPRQLVINEKDYMLLIRAGEIKKFEYGGYYLPYYDLFVDFTMFPGKQPMAY